MENEVLSAIEVKEKKKKKKAQRGVTVFLCVMLAYPIFEFLVSWIFVKFNSILMAFQLPTGEWSLLTIKAVFTDMFDTQSTFSLAVALKNTFLWLLMSVFSLFFHYFIAYVFYKKMFGTHFFRIVFYIPVILSEVVVATVFKNFILTNGPLADIVKIFGIEKLPQLLANPDYANKMVFFYNFWTSWGGHMLLLGGALVRVPMEVIESARIDGVGVWRELVQILFPMTWGSFSTLFVLTFTGIFGVSNSVLMLTHGYNGTVTVGYWIYHRTYFDGASAYNQVAATGLIFTVVGALIALGIRWLVERIPAVEY